MEKTGPKVTCLPAVFFAEVNSSCFTLTARGGGGRVLPLLQHTEGFKKRWFTMDDRRLMYFKDPLVLCLCVSRHLENPCG